MNTKLSRKGYMIQKSSVAPQILDSIRTELTVKPFVEDYGDDVQPFPVFSEDTDNIYLPRYYGISKFGKPKLTTLTSNKSSTKFKFTGLLRDYQTEIVDKCLKSIRGNGGGLLSVGCGQGKTTMALKIATELGLKTLVLVHKTFLQDQWIERAKQFTNAKIGIIRQNTIQVDGFDIVIGMVQSISMRDYDQSIFDQFDFLICDEAHRYGSRVFSRALQKVGAKHTFSLSATPKRLDGLTKVINWFMGDTIFSQPPKPNKHVIAKVFKYQSDDPLFVEKKMWCKGSLKASNTKMITNLINIKSRNDHIINIINELRKYPERKILILSGRRDHLTHLKDSVDKFIQEDIKNGKILDKECRTYYYVGGMKKLDRHDAELYGDILFGTYEMAQEGLDIDRLNTIILATPKKNITQAVGRIMRKILQSGDIKPLVIDMYDQLSIYASQGDKRLVEYTKNKYKVKTYFLNNSNITKYEDYLMETFNLKESEIAEFKDDADSYENNLQSILDVEKIDNDDFTEEPVEIEDNKPVKADFNEYLFD
jgi:superfamily II DNA or RNA helicase